MPTAIQYSTVVKRTTIALLVFALTIILSMTLAPARAQAYQYQWFNRDEQILSAYPEHFDNQYVRVPRGADPVQYLPTTATVTVNYVEDLELGPTLTRTEQVPVTWRLTESHDNGGTYYMEYQDEYWANALSYYTDSYIRNMYVSYYEGVSGLPTVDVAVSSSNDPVATKIQFTSEEGQTGKLMRITPRKTHMHSIYATGIEGSQNTASIELFNEDGSEFRATLNLLSYAMSAM